jgi:hypothetical protein
MKEKEQLKNYQAIAELGGKEKIKNMPRIPKN